MRLSEYRRVYVAGHRGLVGSALVRAFDRRGRDVLVRSRAELDLRDPAAVRAWFRAVRPDLVFVAAAVVGGIQANNARRWDFLYENLAIELSVLGAADAVGVERVVFFGSSCIYPRAAPQPIREEYLLTGPLEPTNEPYAVAKIAGLKLVDAANAQHGRHWVSLMPTNLYGPGDNFDLETSHVLPAMIRKFHDAKIAGDAGPGRRVTLWGTGDPRREFLHVDDLAEAALCVAGSDAQGVVNVGFGSDVSIRELAAIVARVVQYRGAVRWDAARPDGTPRKLLDSSRLRALGWAPQISLEAGVAATYAAYLDSIAPEVRGRNG